MRIRLTQGQFTIVDDKNYKWLNQYRWYAHWNKDTKSFYTERYVEIKNGKQRQVSISREILGLECGDKRQADHKNHKTLDNRESNLQIVTCQQNHFNRKNPKGYYWNKPMGKYQAQITLSGKVIHLGCFNTTKKAHGTYLAAKEKYHKI